MGTMGRIALVAGLTAGVFSLGAHGGAAIPASLTAASGGGAASAGCRKLERLWVAAGGRPSQAQTAASVAMAESGGDRNAVNRNSNGTVDRGYWQINSIHGAQSTFRPMANARAAVAISGNGSNWSAWVTYDSGAYAGRC